MNSVLAATGIKGTGSLAARSFLGFGESTDKPNKGDIVVSRRGDNAAQGHVGFYQGTDAKGRVLVLGGNTGDKVGTSAIDRGDVLGFRRAPSASAQFGAEQKIAADALKQQAQDLEQVTAKYLPAVAAAKEYADELERIDRLAKSFDPTKAGSGLSPEQAAQARTAVAAVRDSAGTAIGKGTTEKEKAGALGGSVADALNQIAQQLGGDIGSANVSIGYRPGHKAGAYRVDPTGSGAVKDGAVAAFETEAEAIAYAIRDAIGDGAVTGLSAAVQKALQSSTDVDKALKEALKVQDLETTLGGIGAEVDKAFREFEATAKERLRIATAYGFDVVAIEKRNAEDGWRHPPAPGRRPAARRTPHARLPWSRPGSSWPLSSPGRCPA